MNPVWPSREYYAFFDVDGTLLKAKSTHSFLKYFYRSQYPFKWMGLIKYGLYVTKIKLYEKSLVKRERLNQLYYRNYQGVSKVRLKQLANQWFDELSKNKHLFVKSTLSALQAHQANGAKVILVSGSFQECLAPIATILKVDGVLATQLEESHGICSGQTLGEPMIGQGKSKAIHVYLNQKNYTDFGRCYAYGDHISDTPMLSLVGNAYAIEGDPDLAKYAKACDWQLLSNI